MNKLNKNKLIIINDVQDNLSSERKLATVRQVKELKPIKDADRIELAIIDGWQCVVKKGEFKIGDLGIYIEIDSFVPDNEHFNFLKNKQTFLGKDGYRIKTLKMKGQISQGLFIPLFDKSICTIGQDVTDQLGIIKYEKPIQISLQGLVKGPFPNFIPKTDQERVQNIPDLINEWIKNDELFEVTEKLEGTSFTAYMKDGNFGVCSRNQELKDDGKNVYWQIAYKYKIKEILDSYNRNIAIQGEIVGPNIQGNYYNLSEPTLFIFNIFDIDRREFLKPNERIMLLSETQSELFSVPILEHIKLSKFKNINEILNYANGISEISEKIREGVVFKGINRSISFKVVSNNYLVKNE